MATSDEDKLLKDWADRRPEPSRRCMTCQSGSRYIDLTRKYLEGRRDGVLDGRRHGWKAFYEGCLVPAGYPYSYSTWRNHVTGCEAELHGQATRGK